MQITKLHSGFISEIADGLFPMENGNPTVKGEFFKLRYHPDNYYFENKNSNDNGEAEKTSICQILKKEGRGDLTNTIQTISRKVRDCLLTEYSEEIMADIGEEKVNFIKSPGRGRDFWKNLYQWLWDYQFPRWVEANFLPSLEKQADKNRDWINFADNMVEVDKLHIPQMADHQPLKLSLEKPYWAFINLPESDGYLLLLNQGVVSRCVVCPSQAFAIDYELEKIRLLPQKETLTYELGCRFTFNEVGVEKFVAIALEKPLDLEWLKPNEEEVAPDLNSERMQELWQELEKQNNWRVYAQEVEVVG
ncbi:MAG: hypothetical protein F6K40_00020 [Okeania sp. SIO3I5]|uniref:hypothetical protein n=1 Tax=Okeania sp. SIO3I5 TaxID=2607805 RepID=UPI0013BBAAE4|nr:hypothetical protein [Okeania sp. SIO3I5]NEQ34779.1 hypothetical protein [Okeania sp. SIO3I5]